MPTWIFPRLAVQGADQTDFVSSRVVFKILFISIKLQAHSSRLETNFLIIVAVLESSFHVLFSKLVGWGADLQSCSVLLSTSGYQEDHVTVCTSPLSYLSIVWKLLFLGSCLELLKGLCLSCPEGAVAAPFLSFLIFIFCYLTAVFMSKTCEVVIIAVVCLSHHSPGITAVSIPIYICSKSPSLLSLLLCS